VAVKRRRRPFVYPEGPAGRVPRKDDGAARMGRVGSGRASVRQLARSGARRRRALAPQNAHVREMLFRASVVSASRGEMSLDIALVKRALDHVEPVNA